jgi:hypothetical protein
VSSTPNSLLKSLKMHLSPVADNTNCSQVLRYSALLFGIFYGFSHQRTINANAKAAHAEHEYKHKEALIQKAKAEFAKKNLPPQAKAADGGGEFLSGPIRSVARGCCSPSDPKRHIADIPFHSYYQPGRQEL